MKKLNLVLIDLSKRLKTARNEEEVTIFFRNFFKNKEEVKTLNPLSEDIDDLYTLIKDYAAQEKFISEPEIYSRNIPIINAKANYAGNFSFQNR